MDFEDGIKGGRGTSPARPDEESDTQGPGPERAAARRRSLRIKGAVALALLVAAGLGGGIYVTEYRGWQTTADATLEEVVTPMVADVKGHVVQSSVQDNAVVRKGDLLFRIDPEPYRIALDRAEASLDAARLHVRELHAAYLTAVTSEKTAKEEEDYFRSEYARQKALKERGVATTASLDQARRAMKKAQQAHLAAGQGVMRARAALGGDVTASIEDHPEVRAATRRNGIWTTRRSTRPWAGESTGRRPSAPASSFPRASSSS